MKNQIKFSMKKNLSLLLLALTLVIGLGGAFISCSNTTGKPVKVLILSGSNNHDWAKTTPFLERIYSEAGLFSADITEMPDTLKSSDFMQYDVVVSNWNSFPKTDVRWPEATEKAFLSYLEKGGGLVTFHASSSAFYEWPEFEAVRTAEWVMDSTWHGKKSVIRVKIDNQQHPVTSGMSDFFITDEFWVNAGRNDKFEVLGSATNDDISAKGIQDQHAIMVSGYGKGRIFHTILGHDVPAMRNTGFKTLITRGTEWAATGKVTQSLPQEISETSDSTHEFSWQRTDTTFALSRGKEIVWQYNFNTKHSRPFFHPVYVGKNNITCVSPDDHVWHLGQWFCWKFINGVNYWEYTKGSYKSEGVTEIRNIEISSHPDFSAEIKLEIVYHPVNGENVLSEFRTIQVSPPQQNSSIWMDYQFEFKAIADTVLLDRTPIVGEPDGKTWGGYAGLSIRFNQDFHDSHFISSWNDNENINGRKGDWLYMGFTGLNGQKVGSQIMIRPDSHTEGTAWYSFNTIDLPFYYFSPSALYYQPLRLLKDQELRLNYRILHLAGEMDTLKLRTEFQRYKDLSF
jgi:type 1 glutamine amidotransferase